MAYSNWGAFVFRNGHRKKNHEDAIPYNEDNTPKYPFFLLERNWRHEVFHATLGSYRVRLCAHKTTPRIFFDGHEITKELNPRLIAGRERNYMVKRGHRIVGWREGNCHLLPVVRGDKVGGSECYDLVNHGVYEGVWGKTPPGEKELHWRYFTEHDLIAISIPDLQDESMKFGEAEEGIWEGEIEGYKFRVDRKINETTLELREPNSTLWIATAGYEFGAGYMNDSESVVPKSNL